MEKYQKATGITDFACFSDDSHWMMKPHREQPLPGKADDDHQLFGVGDEAVRQERQDGDKNRGDGARAGFDLR